MMLVLIRSACTALLMSTQNIGLGGEIKKKYRVDTSYIELCVLILEEPDITYVRCAYPDQMVQL